MYKNVALDDYLLFEFYDDRKKYIDTLLSIESVSVLEPQIVEITSFDKSVSGVDDSFMPDQCYM